MRVSNIFGRLAVFALFCGGIFWGVLAVLPGEGPFAASMMWLLTCAVWLNCVALVLLIVRKRRPSAIAARGDAIPGGVGVWAVLAGAFAVFALSSWESTPLRPWVWAAAMAGIAATAVCSLPLWAETVGSETHAACHLMNPVPALFLSLGIVHNGLTIWVAAGFMCMIWGSYPAIRKEEERNRTALSPSGPVARPRALA